ncbi:MAG: GntR family transcriptional regulator [Candidatus Lambdaproteobacteria bacterium]|nr:GntR family transcriptional regulator [Candidatus Lambdaproteobacteria bacterium]
MLPSTSGLPPISPRAYPTYADEVTRVLRDAILEGRLLPGRRLTEPELAQQLGVSRTPIREALRELEHEGLLQRVPGRGTIVAEISSQDVEEIYAVKSALESAAVRSACARISGAELAELERLLQRMKALAEAGDLLPYSRISREFHELLIRSSGNRWLEETYRTLDVRIQQLRIYALATPSRPRVSVAEHEAILAAVRQRDAAAAEGLIRDHVERAGALLSRTLRERGFPLPTAATLP